ncbi:MAG: energy transducer TonB [Cellvibrionaceae bacterium]
MLVYLTRAAMAGLLTVAIFLFMRYLINPQNPPTLEDDPGVDIRITREKRKEETERRQRKLPAEPEQTPPPPPPASQQERVTLGEGQGGYEYDWSEWKAGEGQQMPMDTDRRAMPMVRIPPQYPERALRQGIEGWVLLEFTITPVGTVEEIRIVEAEPPNVFDRASIRALQGWKYQPKMVNGQPVAQSGMRDLIVFEIQD